MIDSNQFYQFAQNSLAEAGKKILSYYRPETIINWKQDKTPVTIADQEAELYLRKMIMEKFPDHGIIAEEFGNHNESAEYIWVIDPIDGTKSFISHTPLFGSLLALMQNGNPLYGAIYLPVTGDLVVGDRSETLWNGVRVTMQPDIALEDSIVLTTDYRDFSRYKPREGFDRLTEKCRITRSWGDCYGYFLVATGHAHVMVDPAMSVWDKMALIPIIEGAGGLISDFYGNDPASGDSIVASVKGLHPKVIDILTT